MGEIRIIAGEFKGRRIKVPSGVDVRPTPNRVREALFSILGREVVDARILDAYSGSGALGFEALSRGARSVLFVESKPEVAELLRQNGARLGAGERFIVIQAGMLELVAESAVGAPFDIILADPPYAAEETAALLRLVSAPAWILPTGLIVLERERVARSIAAAGHGFELDRTARYGRTCLDIYRRHRKSRDN
jgi:16S rRNA (guanine(966)-N(2))-methyltransferase RsmD